MWPFSEMSLSTASLVGTIANWGLLASLVAGLFSTFVIVKTTDRKEEHWAEDRRKSNEFIAGLNNASARLTADNLALQTSLLPRHAGLIGINESAPAAKWFAGIGAFAGMSLFVQFTDDKEAMNLAREIEIIALKFGWKVVEIDGAKSNFNSGQIADGVRVSYPTGKPWTAEEPNQPWFEWTKAADALANALTSAGLAVGDRPVSRYGFTNERPEVPWSAPYFDPPIEGVYLQVGARPVAETVEWIKQGRPDILGNKAVDAILAAH